MIIKLVPGRNLDEHSIAIATKKLESEDPLDRESSLEDLVKIIQEKQAASLEELIASRLSCVSSMTPSLVCAKCETLDRLVSMLGDSSNTLKSQKSICRLLKTLLMDTSILKSKFLQLSGAEKLMYHFQKNNELISSLLDVTVSVCKKHEPSKCKFMNPEFLAMLSNCLEAGSHVEVVFQVLASLTTPDDPETSASQTFMHARLLSQQKFHVRVLTILQSETSKPTNDQNSDVIVHGLDAIRCLAANDEICKEICEANGIEVFMELYKSSSSSPELIKAVNNAMRQLACSDVIKHRVMSLDGASIISQLLMTFEKDGVVIEGLLGLMTIISLRQPQLARAFCNEKCHELIKLAMINFQSDPKVLRQACLCVRNFVVRDPTIKEWMIQLGIESCIRKCKDKFRKECGSEASSALRDLGFYDYK
eukprot:g6956.t1